MGVRKWGETGWVMTWGGGKAESDKKGRGERLTAADRDKGRSCKWGREEESRKREKTDFEKRFVRPQESLETFFERRRKKRWEVSALFHHTFTEFSTQCVWMKRPEKFMAHTFTYKISLVNAPGQVGASTAVILTSLMIIAQLLLPHQILAQYLSPKYS